MTPPDPLRVGLVGYGLAGSVFHAPLVAAVPDLHLSAIVTADRERAALARRRHPGVDVLATADDLLARAGDLDLVVVASPNRTHVPLALAALRAGLAVVVDKPFAATAAEARRMVAEARERHRPLTVFHNRRWDGDFLTARHLIGAGELGEIVSFESRFERWRPVPKPGWRESADPRDAGGVLYDLGPHLIDQALQLFGKPARVYAEIDRRRPGASVDDDVFVALTHDGGVRVRLWMSATAPQPGARFRVTGTRAAYTKFGLDPQEQALKDGARPDAERFGLEPPDRWGIVGEGAGHAVPTEAGCYLAFYELLASALRNGTPVPVDPLDAVAGLEVIEAARRSAAEGRVVEPGPESNPPTRA